MTDQDLDQDLEPGEELLTEEVDEKPDLDEPDLDDGDLEEDDSSAPEETTTLSELAEEELELLAEEEAGDLPRNEAEELRTLRREELTMNVQASAIRGDEFVCSVCFLVKRSSQLANKRKVICRDCAA